MAAPLTAVTAPGGGRVPVPHHWLRLHAVGQRGHPPPPPRARSSVPAKRLLSGEARLHLLCQRPLLAAVDDEPAQHAARDDRTARRRAGRSCTGLAWGPAGSGPHA